MTCTAIYQGVDSGEEAISQDTEHESSLSVSVFFAEKLILVLIVCMRHTELQIMVSLAVPMQSLSLTRSLC